MTAPLFDEYFNTEVYKLLWDFSQESGNQQYVDKNLLTSYIIGIIQCFIPNIRSTY
jgi:hypothetical protein